MTRTFKAAAARGDKDNAREAVNGLDGEFVGMVLKTNRRNMVFGTIHKYRHNNYVFGLREIFGGGTENCEYSDVAEVWR